MEEESRRKHRGGMKKTESWSGGVIIGEAARGRQPGGGSQEEAVRRRQPGGNRRLAGDISKHLRGSQDAHRCVSVSVSVSVSTLSLLLGFCKARGTCVQQSSICEARGDHKCIGWQYVIVKTMCFCRSFFCF